MLGPASVARPWPRAAWMVLVTVLLLFPSQSARADLASESSQLFSGGGDLRFYADGATEWRIGTHVSKDARSLDATAFGYRVLGVGRDSSACFAVNDLEIGITADRRVDAFDDYGQLRLHDPSAPFTDAGTHCYRTSSGTLIRFTNGDLQAIGDAQNVTWSLGLTASAEWYLFYADTPRAPLLRQSLTVANTGASAETFILQRRLDLGSDNDTRLEVSSVGGVALDGLTDMMRWAVAGHRDGDEPTLLHLLNGDGVDGFLATAHALTIPGAPEVGRWQDGTSDPGASDRDKVDQYYTVAVPAGDSVTLAWFVRASFAEAGQYVASVGEAAEASFAVLDARRMAGLPAGTAATLLNWTVSPDTVETPSSAPTTAGPRAVCAPLPAVAGAMLTCDVAGGDPEIDVLWRAAATFASEGVRLGPDGAGSFMFTVPLTAAGRELTIELVEWVAPVSLGAVRPVPRSIPAGDGMASGALLPGVLVLTAAFVPLLRRRGSRT